MKRLAIRLSAGLGEALAVGHLAEHERRVYFEYDPSFARGGIELSPFKLPLRPGLVEHTDLRFGPLPGLFDDSLPDGWGLLLMDRAFRRRGLDPARVSALDRLSWLGTRTVGALTYHPPTAPHAGSEALDLFAAGQNAEEVLAGAVTDVLPELERAGGSPGGARPKVLVGVMNDEVITGEDDLPPGYVHWLIKLAARQDAVDAGPVEYGYALMALAAGIVMPEVRLFEARSKGVVRRYFGVRRFDRPRGNERLHVHTFGNLVHASFRLPSTDYSELLKVTRLLTRNHKDVLRAFRLMVFNVGAHNRDDHAKNFAFLMAPGATPSAPWEWSLSPAYDLTPSDGLGGEHMTSVYGEGRQPGRSQCLELARRSGIAQCEAIGVIDEVNAALARWPELGRQARCRQRTIREIAARIRPV